MWNMVRQGENLYSFLFALYLNDSEEEYLETNNIKKLEKLDNLALEHLNTYIRLFILLYADDTVIFSETLDELQKSLESFEAYCKLWKLEVNVNKTKIIVFLYFLKERLKIDIIRPVISKKPHQYDEERTQLCNTDYTDINPYHNDVYCTRTVCHFTEPQQRNNKTTNHLCLFTCITYL